MKHSLSTGFCTEPQAERISFFSLYDYLAPGQQERLPQALGGLEEERTYLLKLTPPSKPEAQMRGVLTALAAKRPSVGVTARSPGLREESKEKRIARRTQTPGD